MPTSRPNRAAMSPPMGRVSQYCQPRFRFSRAPVYPAPAIKKACPKVDISGEAGKKVPAAGQDHIIMAEEQEFQVVEIFHHQRGQENYRAENGQTREPSVE